MSMQDKDMDELFRSKLDNLEVEPSGRVWKGIIVELDGARQKSTLLPVIRMAAVITVIAAVGLFFLMKNNKTEDEYQAINVIKGKHRLQELSGADANKQKATPLEITQVKPGAKTAEVVEGGKSSDYIKAVISAHQTAGIKASNPVGQQKIGHKQLKEDDKQQIIDITQPVTGPQQTLAAITNTQVDIVQPVVPDQPLTEVKNTATEPDGFTAPVKVASAQLLPAKNNIKVSTKKHGIRSLGDFINVVVAKVDKRQDKVIEFSNTDEDESTITGINLGFVKVKKDK